MEESLVLERFEGIAVNHCAPVGDAQSLPIVFVHGAWGGKWQFENWQRACAAQGYESYALDLRGHHDSPAQNLGALSIRDFADDVEAVIRHVGPCILIGHSMGGLLTQVVASRNANVRKSIIVAAVPPAGIIFINAFLLATTKYVFRMLMNRTVMFSREEAYKFMPQEIADMYDKFVPESGHATLDIGFQRIWVPRLLCPTLVIVAQHDKIMPPGVGKRIARKYGADYIEIPGIAHFLMTEKGWERPIAEMLAWLRRVQVQEA